MATSYHGERWRTVDPPPKGRAGFAWTLVAIVTIASLGQSARAAVATTGPVLDPPLVAKIWRTSDGLPQSSVNALARTADGYLWVGTSGGLARFDGVRFVNYGLADGLRSLSIRALVEDGEGGLWIATLGGGLSRMRRDGTITTLTTADGLLHNEVTAIARSASGLWVATAMGLQHWTPSGGFVQVGKADGVNATIPAIAVSAEGLWGTQADRGLFLCRDGKCEWIVPLERTKERSLFASAFLVDRAGDLWVSMGNGVVARRHAGKWTELNKADGVPFSVIINFVEGPDGTVWASTNETGLYHFRGDRFVSLPSFGPGARALLADRDGIVWTGVRTGGLARLMAPRVTTYRLFDDSRTGQVNGIAEGLDGQLWVTTFGAGLQTGPPRALAPVAEVGKSPLRTALRMSDGTVYISGYRQLSRRDPANGAIRTWAIAEDVRSLCEGADGTLWAGTNAGQLKRLSGNVFEAVPNGTFGQPVMGLTRGSGNSLWVATRGAGLFRWEAGKVEQWTMANGLPTDLLGDLQVDGDGTLWIGTSGGGIAWLEGGRVRAVGQRQGLGDGVVSQILDDGRGNLWLAGIRGIRRLSKAELRAVADGKSAIVHPLVLDEADGMTTAECTGGFAPAGLMSRSGMMYFSTLRDVIAVDPTAFDPVPSPPPVTIETIHCDGQRIALAAGGVVLPPGSKELEIQYTGFDGAKPEQLRFRHRLHKGGDWEYVEGSRVVRFASLEPGAYEFELSAAKADGHWLEPGAFLAITVQPYFWQTTIFRAGVAVGLIAIAAGLVAVVMRRKDRRHRAELAHQRALADAEREIALQRDELTHLSRVTVLGELSGSIAHELNQPLSAIMSNAQAALRFLNEPPADVDEVREILTDIVDANKRASDVITRLRLLFTKGEVVHTRLPPAEVIREVLRLLRSDLLTNSVTVRESIDGGLPAVRGDRVQLQQVLINLVKNACEAMTAMPPASRQLTVGAQREPGGTGLVVSITDSGPGIAPEHLEQIFKPFFSTKSTGMGLGLAVCRTIVTAHGGRLWAEPAEGGGTRFFLALPVAEADGGG